MIHLIIIQLKSHHFHPHSLVSVGRLVLMLQIDQHACYRIVHPFERCELLYHRFAYEAVNEQSCYNK